MVTLEVITHRHEMCRFIRGGIPDSLYLLIRHWDKAKYSRTHRAWYFVDSPVALEQFQQLVKNTVGPVKISETHPPKLAPVLPVEYREKLVSCRYSNATIENYTVQFRKFLEYLEGDVNRIDEREIRQYMVYLAKIKQASISSQNVAINSIKFYLEHVQQGQRKVYYNERPRKENKLPIVLSEEEVSALLQQTKNVKHRLLLILIYSAGLRLSELLNLKWRDIDLDRRVINIRSGKGRKDRITLLSEVAREKLQSYRTRHEVGEYNIEGQEGGRYSPRSVNNIIKRSARSARISKNVSAHTLRHSFATHLLEHGTDLRYIQSLLGHENSKTTERYTQVTRRGFEKLVSPLDNLKLSGNFSDSTPDNKDI